MLRYWHKFESWMRDTRVQKGMAYLFFFGGLISWPVSILTWAAEEPPFVLSLSWLALIISGYTTIVAVQVNDKD